MDISTKRFRLFLDISSRSLFVEEKKTGRLRLVTREDLPPDNNIAAMHERTFDQLCARLLNQH